MIETREYQLVPAAVFQRVAGEVDIHEIERGTKEANEVISGVIDKYGHFNLVVDARGVRFSDLAAHRAWKQTAENHPGIMARLKYFAFVLDDSPNARAEKELMETGTWKFFFDLQEALAWIGNRARGAGQKGEQ